MCITCGTAWFIEKKNTFSYDGCADAADNPTIGADIEYVEQGNVDDVDQNEIDGASKQSRESPITDIEQNTMAQNMHGAKSQVTDTSLIGTKQKNQKIKKFAE